MLSNCFKVEEHSLWALFIRKSVLVFSKFWINDLQGNSLFAYYLPFLHLVVFKGYI